MKKTPPLSEKKRGLGRGLEVLLADTQALDGLNVPDAAEAPGQQPTSSVPGGWAEERRLLLQEAETLRVLLLEFELMIRAELPASQAH